MAWPGHPSVVLWPAILALAGERQATLSEAIAAFVAGYDLASQIGEAMAPGHYAAGFHPTATLGAFASAAASCHMLGASHNQMAHALGIAGTRAAGLKSMFGTMCKPLHAGEASRNGLTAAKLAMQGYQGRTDFIECKQGFAETHSSDFVPDAVPALPYAGYHVRRTLFKFHAACYLTHATIDAAAEIKAAPGFDVARVEAISVETHPMAESVCHIERPTSGLEAKFSLTLAAAMGLMGTGTSRLDVFTDELAVSEPLIALRDKVTVCFNSAMSTNGAIVKVSLNSGLNFVAESDSGEPAASLADQQLRIEKKFSGLVSPILGQQSCDDILAWTRDGALTSKVDGLMSLVRSKRI
jgi:2-methylcitrate dehydratase PrpD